MLVQARLESPKGPGAALLLWDAAIFFSEMRVTIPTHREGQPRLAEGWLKPFENGSISFKQGKPSQDKNRQTIQKALR